MRKRSNDRDRSARLPDRHRRDKPENAKARNKPVTGGSVGNVLTHAIFLSVKSTCLVPRTAWAQAAVNACTSFPTVILIRQAAQVKDFSGFHWLARPASMIRLDLIVHVTWPYSQQKSRRHLTGKETSLYNNRCKLFNSESERGFLYSILISTRQSSPQERSFAKNC